MVRNKKKLKNQRPAIEVCQTESVQNAASTLLANIRFSAVDAPLKTVVFTSSVPNEGKTTVALSLAMAAGKSGNRTLIVEADMRRRSLRAIIGAKPRHGIHALLTGKSTVDETVVSTDFENLYFLDAEAGIPNPDGILSSRMFSNLLASLRDTFDYVIMDTPPITAFPDASIAASKADATILVARENYTDKREITFALQQLRAADANVLGVALNCQTGSNGAYGYYYGYYYDEKTVAADSPEAQEALGRVKRGDSNVTVKPVGGSATSAAAATDLAPDSRSKKYEVPHMSSLPDRGASQTTGPITPPGGPTAQAPGSRARTQYGGPTAQAPGSRARTQSGGSQRERSKIGNHAR